MPSNDSPKEDQPLLFSNSIATPTQQQQNLFLPSDDYQHTDFHDKLPIAQDNTSMMNNTDQNMIDVAPGEEVPLVGGGKENDNDQEQPFRYSDIPLPTFLIICVECFERFSFYGLVSMLVLFLTKELHYTESTAKTIYSFFTATMYFFPLLGAFISDSLLTRFTTMVIFLIVYISGSSLLTFTSFSDIKWMVFPSLFLIALGGGALKSNVNIFAGEQLKTTNPVAISTYMALFYFSINLGSLGSTLTLPIVEKYYGYTITFSIPMIGLITAFLIFISGYRWYTHKQPSESLFSRIFKVFAAARSGKKLHQRAQSDGERLNNALPRALSSKRTFKRNVISSQHLQNQLDNDDIKIHWLDYAKMYYKNEHVEEIKAVLALLPIFPFFSLFWLCFDQNGSVFVLQAEKLDRMVWGFEILSPQITALNAICILLFVPLFDGVIYPILRRCGFQLKHLNRVLAGMVATMFAFLSSAYVDWLIAHNEPNTVPIAYQLPQYLLLTIAEILVSVSGLEFIFLSAPPSFRSTISSFYNLTITLGDILAGILFSTVHIKPYLFSLMCVGLMGLNFIIFFPIALWFNAHTSVGGETNDKKSIKRQIAHSDNNSSSDSHETARENGPLILDDDEYYEVYDESVPFQTLSDAERHLLLYGILPADEVTIAPPDKPFSFD